MMYTTFPQVVSDREGEIIARMVLVHKAREVCGTLGIMFLLEAFQPCPFQRLP